MSFEQSKKDTLSRMDKSNKGSVDAPILYLLDLINKRQNYYSTSSCSGRIRLLVEAKSQRKCDSEVLFTSHELVEDKRIDELWDQTINFAKQNSEDSLWFKQEALILHIACKDTDSAIEFLNLVRESGLKRSGIISLGKAPVVEILGSERLETIIVRDGKVLVTKEYLTILLEEANKRFAQNSKRIKRLEEALKV